MMPPLTLALDAATYAGTVALVDGSRVVAEREVAMRGEKEERLMPAVEQLLMDVGLEPAQLDRVGCGGGPGSFTSLRIAASIAKGLAAGGGVPLFTASSLLLMVAGSATTASPGRYLAVLDALRGDAYVAGYEVTSGGEIGDGTAGIVDIAPAMLLAYHEVEELARSLGARRIGPREELVAVPRAAGFARIAAREELREPADIASWEPDYGRLAEAQVRWEREHGRPLVDG